MSLENVSSIENDEFYKQFIKFLLKFHYLFIRTHVFFLFITFVICYCLITLHLFDP